MSNEPTPSKPSETFRANAAENLTEEEKKTRTFAQLHLVSVPVARKYAEEYFSLQDRLREIATAAVAEHRAEESRQAEAAADEVRSAVAPTPAQEGDPA